MCTRGTLFIAIATSQNTAAFLYLTTRAYFEVACTKDIVTVCEFCEAGDPVANFHFHAACYAIEIVVEGSHVKNMLARHHASLPPFLCRTARN